MTEIDQIFMKILENMYAELDLKLNELEDYCLLLKNFTDVCEKNTLDFSKIL